MGQGYQGRIQVWAGPAPALLLTAKSCKFSLFWGYITNFDTQPPLFLQILDPALNIATFFNDI